MNKKVWQKVEERSEGLCEFPTTDGPCKRNFMVQKHHAFGGSNREKMEMAETVFNLCELHHNDHLIGVHHCKENRLIIKRAAIQNLLDIGWTKEKIIKEVGRYDGE